MTSSSPDDREAPELNSGEVREVREIIPEANIVEKPDGGYFVPANPSPENRVIRDDAETQ